MLFVHAVGECYDERYMYRYYSENSIPDVIMEGGYEDMKSCYLVKCAAPASVLLCVS